MAAKAIRDQYPRDNVKPVGLKNDVNIKPSFAETVLKGRPLVSPFQDVLYICYLQLSHVPPLSRSLLTGTVGYVSFEKNVISCIFQGFVLTFLHLK